MPAETVRRPVKGHLHNVSPATFVQMISVERETCALGVRAENRQGVLFFVAGGLDLGGRVGRSRVRWCGAASLRACGRGGTGDQQQSERRGSTSHVMCQHRVIVSEAWTSLSPSPLAGRSGLRRHAVHAPPVA